MIFLLKDGRRMAPVRIGSADSPDGSASVFGINIDSANKDLFGKPAVEEFSVADIHRVFGSYSFAPEQWILEDGRQVYLEAAEKIGESDVF